MTKILWDSGTAYDFFISLFVLHYAEEFGLRPAWAAGVRQRLSSERRDFLVHTASFSTPPLVWIRTLPAPKDAATALQAAAALPPAERLGNLTLNPEAPSDIRRTLQAIAARGSWTEAEQKFLQAKYTRRGTPIRPAAALYLLKTWAEVETSGEILLAALQEYQQAFFAEEEVRIRPVLEAGLQRARELAERLPVEALIEDLSHGIHFAGQQTVQELTLVPSYWTSPLIFILWLKARHGLMAFGVRPEVESVTPGDETPNTLVTALKSLADPTRLRILRYLAGQPQPPSELARRLRLRPPTVVHHLKLLRLAGLVHVTVGEHDEKLYASRLESLQGIFSSLEEFLSQTD